MQRLQIADPPESDQVAAAIGALRQGRLVVLPTETVYGLAADPHNSAAVADLVAVKARPAGQPFTHHLSTSNSLEGLAEEPPRRLRAFLDRVWPGPLTAILPGLRGPAAADRSNTVGLRVPAHAFTREVLAGFEQGLYMTSVNPSGAAPLNDPDAIAAAFADDQRVSLLADSGPPELGEPSAVIRLDGRRIEVLREGLYDSADILLGAAAKVLFVCTGNTCRSPLAEVLARGMAAAHLGIRSTEVLAHGLCFASVGTGTLAGMPASGGSIEAAAEHGLDLTLHRSGRLDPELIDEFDKIYCMSASHLADVLHTRPEAGTKTDLLDPDGAEVTDPFGRTIEIYRRTRDDIERFLRRRLDEIIAL